jgi:hypothetical protein
MMSLEQMKRRSGEEGFEGVPVQGRNADEGTGYQVIANPERYHGYDTNEQNYFAHYH